MSSPKEIAERIINQNEFKQEEFMWLVHNSEVLARAYLDAAKELETTKAALSELEKELSFIKCAEIPVYKEEITKLKEENEKLRACEARLKKSREGLRKAFEVIARGESQFDNVDHMYTAREALEADDNLMKEV